MIHKYRAWDEDAKYMFYSDKDDDEYFFAFQDGKLRGYAIRPPRPSSDPMEAPEPYTDDYPVMQFTSRTDKNNKEIYVKDHLRTPGGQTLLVNPTDLINGDGKFRSIEVGECEIIGNEIEGVKQ